MLLAGGYNLISCEILFVLTLPFCKSEAISRRKRGKLVGGLCDCWLLVCLLVDRLLVLVGCFSPAPRPPPFGYVRENFDA